MNNSYSRVSAVCLFVLCMVPAFPLLAFSAGTGNGEENAPPSVLTAEYIVGLLESGDQNGLRSAIEAQPQLPWAILTSDGLLPLGYAAGTGNTNMVGILLEANAPLDAQDQLERTALYLATVNEQEDVALQLISAGADVNLPDDQGTTPLHLAAKYGMTTLVESLLTHEAEPDSKAGHGYTPLAMASFFGHYPIVKLLCDASSDVNSANQNGATVLHCAVKGGNPDVVQFLLKRGAKTSAKDIEGHTPLDWAKTDNNSAMERILLGEEVFTAKSLGIQPFASNPPSFKSEMTGTYESDFAPCPSLGSADSTKPAPMPRQSAKARNSEGEDDDSKSFERLLKQGNMIFAMPDGFEIKTRTLDRNIHFAIRSKYADYEAWYSVRPLKPQIAAYRERMNNPPPDVVKQVEIHPNKSHVAEFVSLLQHVGGRTESGPSELDDDAIRKVNNSEWVAVADIDTTGSDFTAGFAFCTIIALHADDKANAYIFLLNNDPEGTKELFSPALEALQFE